MLAVAILAVGLPASSRITRPAIRVPLDAAKPADPKLLITAPAPADLASEMVCARGVCVLPDEAVAPEICTLDDDGSGYITVAEVRGPSNQ